MHAPNQLTERVAAQIVLLLPAHSHILVGLSGGVDSVVLLNLLHQLAPKFSWQLSALHVHHGISPNADVWMKLCTELCAGYDIPLVVEHVDIKPLREQYGIEASARKLRLAAFAKQSCDVVALAHHADDQSETLLLQLLRGAGVRGVSAMPLFSVRSNHSTMLRTGGDAETSSDGVTPHTSTDPELKGYGRSILRPLLHCSRKEILDYAAAHQLQWIDDESNADDRYPRNFLRHRVLPLLGEKFPAYRDTLSRSAQHFAEASNLLDELAHQDAAQAMEGEILAVSALQSLSLSRAKNLLRYFLHQCGAPMPQAVQLDEILQQLCNASEDASVCINFGDWQVRRYQGRTYVIPASTRFDKSMVLAWHGEPALDWPAMNKRLLFSRSSGNGISQAKLQLAPVTLRFRQGGEALRPHQNASTRKLKNLLQEHHIPPWQRDRLPLLYCGNNLVCVVGVAIAIEFQVATDEMGVSIAAEDIKRFELN